MIQLTPHPYGELPEDFYNLQNCDGFKNPFVVYENKKLKDDINIQNINAEHLLSIFNGDKTIKSLKPLSMVYSGHQFGQYVSQLGDGRGLLLGQVKTGDCLLDIHLKGAGKTPYSRFGDGRAVLRSVIREYACGEAMHALSIPTSRALMIIGSDEPVIREKTENAAMLVRTAQTHIRFGNFEFFHYQNQPKKVKTLVDFCIEEYPNFFSKNKNTYEDFFQIVVSVTAKLIAKWQGFGFNHGVMNTDNMSILGETFDYGPYGFMEDYSPTYICNHSDHQGRYAYKNQPYIGLWNCSALGHALSSLISETQQKKILETYEITFQKELSSIFRKKLGFKKIKDEDTSLIQGLLNIMESEQLDYTNTFRNLSIGLSEIETPELNSEIAKSWIQSFQKRHEKEDRDKSNKAMAMKQINPKFILRNYMAQEAIELAEKSDFSKLENLIEIISNPFKEQERYQEYAKRSPAWAKNLEISCSS